ncbi:MAG: hypothetical protein M1833_001726 [Piccolia ochrophora]|nr:MAG: hypothetical protein M1833_001726 [Piccolia ochrophora]
MTSIEMYTSYQCPCCHSTEKLSLFSHEGNLPWKFESWRHVDHQRSENREDTKGVKFSRTTDSLGVYFSAASHITESSEAANHTSFIQEAGLTVNGRDWSGKGQHVQYKKGDRPPLTHIAHVNVSGNVGIDEVSWGRVRLARKTVKCVGRVKLESAMKEVIHLQHLRHPHVIQLVGTYLQGHDFAILLYPVADFDLDKFLDKGHMLSYDHAKEGSYDDQLWRAFSCLASAVAYVHDQGIKHMDIKPRNILVKRMSCKRFRIYITDFDIARKVAPDEDSNTNGPTGRTPRYCAPEVAVGGDVPRSRSADIFSLGCVYLEIFTVIVGESRDSFEEFRSGTDATFSNNLRKVIDWLQLLIDGVNSPETRSDPRFWRIKTFQFEDVSVFNDISSTFRKMLSIDPNIRPTAEEVSWEFPKELCCYDDPLPLQEEGEEQKTCRLSLD